jgi:hypothetical protein
LNALLGEVDIAGDARRRGEHIGPLATVRVGHGNGDLLHVVHATTAVTASGATIARNPEVTRTS